MEAIEFSGLESGYVSAVPKPIWERENAELISSSPGLDQYAIWKYIPGEEGVMKFPRFDNLDPLPHHYYKSREEYENARRMHQLGGDPEKIIYIHTFHTRETVVEAQPSPVYLEPRAVEIFSDSVKIAA